MPRKYNVKADVLQNIDLTLAGSAIKLRIYDAGSKLGEIKLGRGTITWYKRNAKRGTPYTWKRFAEMMDSID